MFTRIGATATVAAVFLTFAQNAQATFFTSNGDVQVTSPQDVSDPPIDNIKSLSGATTDSRVFTNQVSGTPFVSGEIRTVTAQLISSARNGLNRPIEMAPEGAPVDALIAITALKGTLVGAGTALFTEGRLFLIAAPNLTFDPLDPESWNWFAASNPIAEYALSVPENVVPTPFGSPVGAPAALINLSALNTVLGVPSGNFIFREDSTPGQNAAAIGDDGSGGALDPNTGGDNFIHNVDPIPGIDAAFEGLFVQVSQNVQGVNPNTGVSFDGTHGNANDDLDVLNAIAARANLGDLGDPGTAFATGLGAADTEFGGTLTGTFTAPTTTGDFQAEVSTTAHIGISNLPEPSSLALLGIAGAALGLYSRRQRRGQATRKDS